MPNFTPNLDLIKPLGSENFSVSHVNSNADKVDAAYGNVTLLIDKVDEKTQRFYVDVESFSGSDTQKVQSAMDLSNGRKLRFQDNKTYIIESPIVGVSNIAIIGNNTTLKVKDGIRVIDGILDFKNKSNVSVTGITFDMNMANMPTYTAAEYATNFNVGLNFYNCSGHIKVTDCKFINLYNISINLQNSNGLITIERNTFNSLAQNQNQKATHIWMLTIPFGTNISIAHNRFINDSYSNAALGVNAVFMAGVKAQTIFEENYMNYCGRNNVGSHRLLPIDLYGDCQNIVVRNNILDNCIYGFARIHNCKNITFEKNKFTYSGATLEESAIIIVNDTVYTVNERCDSIKIINNEFYAKSTSRILEAIRIYTYDWAQHLSNISIEKNSFYGNITLAIQMYFGYDTISIIGNKCFEYDGFTPAQMLNLSRMPWNPVETGKLEVDVVSKGLVINGNQWRNANRCVYMEKGTHTGTIDAVMFESNNIKGVTGFNGIHSRNVKVLASANMMEGYSSGIRVDGDVLFVLFNNIMTNTLYGIYKADASNVVINQNYNNGTLIV